MFILTKTLVILALLMACEISAFGSPDIGETTITTDIGRKPPCHQPLVRYRQLTLDTKGYLSEKTNQPHYNRHCWSQLENFFLQDAATVRMLTHKK